MGQGCHWTFAKITENLRVRAVSQKNEHKKRQKVQKEKDEIGENRENGKRETDRWRTDRAKNNGKKRKITENNGKSATLTGSFLYGFGLCERRSEQNPMAREDPK